MHEEVSCKKEMFFGKKPFCMAFECLVVVFFNYSVQFPGSKGLEILQL